MRGISGHRNGYAHQNRGVQKDRHEILILIYSVFDNAVCRGRNLLRGSTISSSIGPNEGIVINVDVMTYIATENL